jgi:RHS repeat-associated protein
MQLYYNTGNNKQYNGNIAYQLWGVPGNLNKSYTYGYDQLNRLTQGNSTDGNNENAVTYDPMGNIATLNRYASGNIIDQLTYNYVSNSNRLQSVNDATSSDAGQRHGLATYDYDINGNLTADNSKGITNITYNLLNLPMTITGRNTTYTYSATGEKLRRVLGTSATDYVSGIQYQDGVLAFVQTEEGRALPNGAQFYNYEYSLKDHLGNSRVNFDTGTGAARKVQTDDYYPFGMDIIPSGSARMSPQNNYLYNGKELQEDLKLYDYGARLYDPVIARWTSIDPLAEISRRWSPYNYVENNPITLTDPDGMQAEETEEEWRKAATDRSMAIGNALATAHGLLGVDANNGVDANRTSQKDEQTGQTETPTQTQNTANQDETALKPGMTFYGVPVFFSTMGDLKYHAAFTLPGIGIFINPEDRDNIATLRHEFGHWLVALREGNKTFYAVDVPLSLLSAKFTKSNQEHQNSWTEVRANDLSYLYFGRPADWDFKTYHVSDKIRYS